MAIRVAALDDNKVVAVMTIAMDARAAATTVKTMATLKAVTLVEAIAVMIDGEMRITSETMATTSNSPVDLIDHLEVVHKVEEIWTTMES